MNVPNNKRRQESRKKIVEAFMEMMQTSTLEKISVTELCKKAGVNRTTFYACYEDVYDLAREIVAVLQERTEQAYHRGEAGPEEKELVLPILQDIYTHQLYYKTCYKLGVDNIQLKPYALEHAREQFDDKYIKYHLEFFRAGFNRIIQIWLDGGCQETPEEMNEILKVEYAGRQSP